MSRTFIGILRPSLVRRRRKVGLWSSAYLCELPVQSVKRALVLTGQKISRFNSWSDKNRDVVECETCWAGPNVELTCKWSLFLFFFRAVHSRVPGRSSASSAFTLNVKTQLSDSFCSGTEEERPKQRGHSVFSKFRYHYQGVNIPSIVVIITNMLGFFHFVKEKSKCFTKRAIFASVQWEVTQNKLLSKSLTNV